MKIKLFQNILWNLQFNYHYLQLIFINNLFLVLLIKLCLKNVKCFPFWRTLNNLYQLFIKITYNITYKTYITHITYIYSKNYNIFNFLFLWFFTQYKPFLSIGYIGPALPTTFSNFYVYGFSLYAFNNSGSLNLFKFSYI